MIHEIRYKSLVSPWLFNDATRFACHCGHCIWLKLRKCLEQLCLRGLPLGGYAVTVPRYRRFEATSSTCPMQAHELLIHGHEALPYSCQSMPDCGISDSPVSLARGLLATASPSKSIQTVTYSAVLHVSPHSSDIALNFRTLSRDRLRELPRTTL